MSRVGNKLIKIPDNVDINISNGVAIAKGPLGMLKINIHNLVVVDKITKDGLKFLKLSILEVNKFSKSIWGTTRSLINNMILGVSEGFSINLELYGVGYRADVKGDLIVLSLGYSHDVFYHLPDGVNAKSLKPSLLNISGIDKQRISQIASEIMSYRPVEPYKGKGIFIEGSNIRRKEGKKK